MNKTERRIDFLAPTSVLATDPHELKIRRALHTGGVIQTGPPELKTYPMSQSHALNKS